MSMWSSAGGDHGMTSMEADREAPEEEAGRRGGQLMAYPDGYHGAEENPHYELTARELADMEEAARGYSWAAAEAGEWPPAEPAEPEAGA
jgi:hypothetical protein